MFTIAEIQVDDSVSETKFACDLYACKGACCTFPGGRGAPVKDEEVFEIEKAFPFVKTMLPKEHLASVEKYGLVDGYAGYFATQCVDGKACVFVYYDDGIAKCAFEKAFLDGKIQWRKPLSCHLFPIRINYIEESIAYEYFHECDPALKRGSAENIPLYKFIDEPLERAFGKKWTQQLQQKIERSS